jgi:hypothetical protein
MAAAVSVAYGGSWSWRWLAVGLGRWLAVATVAARWFLVLDGGRAVVLGLGRWLAVATKKLLAKVLAMVVVDGTVEEHGFMHHTCSM